ncbi:MAG: hypothetical protein AB1467_02735 [Candidatus Diapherotrites archaeon]
MKKYLIIAVGFILLSGIAMAPTTDEETATASVTVNTFVSITLTDLNQLGIAFGGLDPGASNRPADQNAGNGTVRITNDLVSNKTIDLYKYGTNFTGAGTITISNVQYDTDNNVLAPAPVTMPSAYTDTLIDLAPGSSQEFWYWINIPSSQTAGAYTSTFYYKGQ